MKRKGKLKERHYRGVKRVRGMRHVPGNRPVYDIEMPDYIDRFNRLFSAQGTSVRSKDEEKQRRAG